MFSCKYHNTYIFKNIWKKLLFFCLLFVYFKFKEICSYIKLESRRRFRKPLFIKKPHSALDFWWFDVKEKINFTWPNKEDSSKHDSIYFSVEYLFFLIFSTSELFWKKIECSTPFFLFLFLLLLFLIAYLKVSLYFI